MLNNRFEVRVVAFRNQSSWMFIRVRQIGFTLTELMVAIAVLSILLSLAAPSFQSLIAQSRLTAISTQLRSALLTARSEAIKSNRQVTVCASENQSSCSNGSWGSGSIAFIDRDIIGKINDGDEIIKQFQRASSTLQVLQTGLNGSVSFTPDGASDSSGAFMVCDQSGNAEPRRVCLSRSGAVDVRKDECVEHSIACPT